MMMAPPQVVGVLLKKPGEQSHSRLSPLDPQDTKIRGELYVEDLNERRIVSVRMGWLWVEGTQMRLPLRALNLRQATPGICQPHVLALGFTLSNSQGDPLATFWADTEPIYWSWVRAIAAELVRQTPFRAQRCLNFLEILTICPRGPIPLPDSPTERRRRSRSELRCWLGDSTLSMKNTRSSSILEDSRRRARSELRCWSSSNSSDEDLHLSEFRAMETTLLPKVETTLAVRTWGCSESSEGSDDSLPWGAGCRSSVDSIDSAPSIPEADTRELRIQRYKETRRRENEARSRRVLEEDAKRRKARQEENNNNNNEPTTENRINVTQKCSRLCDDEKNNGNDLVDTSNNARTVTSRSNDVDSRFLSKTASTERENVSINNRRNVDTTKITIVADSRCKNVDSVVRRVSETIGDSSKVEIQDKTLRDNRNNGETMETRKTRNHFDETAKNGEKASRMLSEVVKESVKISNEDTTSRDRRNNMEIRKTTRSMVSTGTENARENFTALERDKLSRNLKNNIERTKIVDTKRENLGRTSVEIRKTIIDPFVKAAETVDAITRRLPPLRVIADSPNVRFRENDGCRHEDSRNNNKTMSNGNNNNREISMRCKIESPPSPGVVRTDSGERRSRARERRNIREKSQISMIQQSQKSEITENSLKTNLLQERLSLATRIPIVGQDFGRTSSNSRIFEKNLDSRERAPVSLPRNTMVTLVDDKSSSSCEEDVARLLKRCQRVDRYVPVREKLTLFESLSRMGGRLARSTEDLGRSSLRPSPKGKQRARSLHDLNRATRSLPVREMCRLFEGEVEQNNSGGSLIVVSNVQSKFNDNSIGKSCWKDQPISILKNNCHQDVPACVRTSTRRKHYEK